MPVRRRIHLRAGFVTHSTLMIFLLRLLRRRTDAQDLIEYGLLIGVVTLSVVLATRALGVIVTNMYTNLLSILQL